MSWTREDVVWLAGLLEGEGSFIVKPFVLKSGMPSSGICVSLGMTDRDVVERAAVLMGCRVTTELRPNGWKSCHYARVSARKAYAISVAVFPFMGLRRQQAIRALVAAWLAVGTIRDRRVAA